jgi:flagellar basal body rod protein FlgG
MDDLSVNASALQAFPLGLQTTAHNIANVSTGDFHSWTYAYQSGPADRGVEFVPKDGFSEETATGAGADARRAQEAERYALWNDLILNNDVDLAREMTNMIWMQRAYEANAASLRSLADTGRVFLDIMV